MISTEVTIAKPPASNLEIRKREKVGRMSTRMVNGYGNYVLDILNGSSPLMCIS